MRMNDALVLVSRRLRLARAVASAERTFVVGAVATLLLLVAARLSPSFSLGAELPLLLAPVLAAAVMFAVGWLTGGVDRMGASVELDRRLDLKEQASTATWIASDGAAGEVSAAVLSQADRRVEPVSPDRIRAAFRVPFPRRLLIYLPVLLIAFLGVPFVPQLGEARAERDAADTAREKQEVREAVRKLEKRAEEIARAAELAKLDEARRMARKVEDEASKMSTETPARKEALTRLSKLSDKLHKDLAKSLQAEDGDAFGLAKPSLGALSDLAAELDQLDPHGLSLDVDSWRASMLDELKRASSEGRAYKVDEKGLRDLMDRIRDYESLLEQMKREFEQLDSEEYARLTGEQIELLRRLAEKLSRIASSCNGSGGCSMSAEELEKLLERLEKLTDEELEKLIEAMNSACAGTSLGEMISHCKSEIGGSFGKMGDAEIGQMLSSLSKLMGRSSGQKNQMGNRPGQAAGGEAPLGPDGEYGDEEHRVRGKLDPTGQLGRRVPFQGIPQEKDAKLELDAAIDRAAAAAEEGMGRDLLPPDAKPYVRRYFDALKKKSSADDSSDGN